MALYAAEAAQAPEVRLLAVAHQHVVGLQWQIVFRGVDNYRGVILDANEILHLLRLLDGDDLQMILLVEMKVVDVLSDEFLRNMEFINAIRVVYTEEISHAATK